MSTMALESKTLFEKSVSPLRELAAYEALWSEKGASFKSIADKFRNVEATPSELVEESIIHAYSQKLSEQVKELYGFGIRVHGTLDYPNKLRDAANPVEVLCYQGNWDLVDSLGVAVVGARRATEEGLRRTRKITKHLVKDGYTVISGLAAGVDTVAHETAIYHGGNTIGVLGTPLNESYPRSNQDLQKSIAQDHLLISQVPFLRYKEQDYRNNRAFFPQRNITMSALSLATVIVEASDTSGTLYQARAAISQNRKLFILDSCFKNPSITWPAKFEKKGAIRVKSYEDIREHLDEHKTSVN